LLASFKELPPFSLATADSRRALVIDLQPPTARRYSQEQKFFRHGFRLVYSITGLRAVTGGHALTLTTMCKLLCNAVTR
jgi:hypothetical protein